MNIQLNMLIKYRFALLTFHNVLISFLMLNCLCNIFIYKYFNKQYTSLEHSSSFCHSLLIGSPEHHHFPNCSCSILFLYFCIFSLLVLHTIFSIPLPHHFTISIVPSRTMVLTFFPHNISIQFSFLFHIIFKTVLFSFSLITIFSLFTLAIHFILLILLHTHISKASSIVLY